MTYKIRPGDTLSKLAKRNGISLAQLLKANPQITNPDRIQVGQVVNLPDTSTETTQPLPSNVVPAITKAVVIGRLIKSSDMRDRLICFSCQNPRTPQAKTRRHFSEDRSSVVPSPARLHPEQDVAVHR